MKSAYRREIERMVRDCGLILSGLETFGCNHIRVTCTNSAGLTRWFSFGATSSDVRAMRNNRAKLRRFSKAEKADKPNGPFTRQQRAI